MTRLQELLAEFKATMLIKFHERRDRAILRWGSSVTSPDFDWNALDLEGIEQHFREEIAEWLQADPEDRLEEDVDIANMAFLDWVARRRDP